MPLRMGIESWLPEPPKPATAEQIDAAMRMFMQESIEKNKGFTRSQHIDYATHATAIWLNL